MKCYLLFFAIVILNIVAYATLLSSHFVRLCTRMKLFHGDFLFLIQEHTPYLCKITFLTKE